MRRVVGAYEPIGDEVGIVGAVAALPAVRRAPCAVLELDSGVGDADRSAP